MSSNNYNNHFTFDFVHSCDAESIVSPLPHGVTFPAPLRVNVQVFTFCRYEDAREATGLSLAIESRINIGRQSQESDQFSSGFCQPVVLESDDRFIYRLLIDRVTSASGWFFSISDVDGHRPEKKEAKTVMQFPCSLIISV